MALTSRQQRFVEEYCVDFNATQAAVRAGYSKKTARQVGSENLTKPDIQKAVAAATAELSKQTTITKEWIIREAEDTYRHARSLNQTAPARGALELIARLHGYIIDRKDVRKIRSFEDLTDEELALLGEIPERQQKLGGRQH